MFEQRPDYAAIRRNIEKRVAHQKKTYRNLFFVMHLIFYVVTMVIVWGIVASDSLLRDVLFNSAPGAGAIVILPTILWTAVLLFHIASLYFESGAGEKAIREQFFMREVGEEIVRKGLMDEEPSEKPKRREAEYARLSDDGELGELIEDGQMGWNADNGRGKINTSEDIN